MKKTLLPLILILTVFLFGCDISEYIPIETGADTDAASDTAGDAAEDIGETETAAAAADAAEAVKYVPTDLSPVDRITVVSGATGQSADITDREGLDHILGFIGSLEGENGRSSRGYYGALSVIELYSGEEKLCSYTMEYDYGFIYDDGVNYDEAGGFRYPYMFDIPGSLKEKYREISAFVSGVLDESGYYFPPDAISLSDIDLSAVTSVDIVRKGVDGAISKRELVTDPDAVTGIAGYVSGISGAQIGPAAGAANVTLSFFNGQELLLILTLEENGSFVVTYTPEGQISAVSGRYRADGASAESIAALTDILG